MLNIVRVATRRAGLLQLCGLIALFGLTACGGTKTDRSEIARPDPLWGQFLESHTTGVISRRSNIRVVFATDVASADRIGEDAAATFTIEPHVDGAVAFTSARELVFTPRRELAPGTAYRVSIKPTGLIGVPTTLRPFEFAVDVKRPEFDVSLGGLTNDPEQERSMRVAGVLMTSDVEAREKVEQLLTATYRGRTIPIDWTHTSDGQRHEFVLRSLARDEEEQV